MDEVAIVLLVIGAAVVLTAVLRVRTAARRADVARADGDLVDAWNGVQPHGLPTWAEDPDRPGRFDDMVARAVIARGIPLSYARSMASQVHFASGLMTHAASMERSGASFKRQAAAAAQLIEQAWRRLPPDGRTAFIIAGRDAVETHRTVQEPARPSSPGRDGEA